MILQKHTCWDLTSCCIAGVYQMFPVGRLDEFPRPDFSLAYRLHRLLHSAQSVDETCG